MASDKRNTEWQNRVRHLFTKWDLVKSVVDQSGDFERLMRRYQRPVLDYLNWLLLHHKDRSTDATAKEAAEEIWLTLMEDFPKKLISDWKSSDTSFRDLLRESVHEAHHSWHWPKFAKTLGYNSSSDENAAWRAAVRRDVLAKARESLRAYQTTNSRKGNKYHTLFCIWESNRDKSDDDLLTIVNTKMTAGQSMSPENFRQTLGRARDSFGRYLFDEITEWLSGKTTPDQAMIRNAFEELDLIDDYGMKSKSCRKLLGMHK